LGIKGNASPPLITTALGIALVMTAVCVLSHRWLRLLTATRHAEPDPPAGVAWVARIPFRLQRARSTGSRKCEEHAKRPLLPAGQR
jgi:hypothetical protein